MYSFKLNDVAYFVIFYTACVGGWLNFVDYANDFWIFAEFFSKFHLHIY